VSELSWPAQLNMLCDQMASSSFPKETDHLPHQFLDSTIIELHHKGEPITSNIPNVIRHAYNTQDFRQYMQQKWLWPDDVIDSVDWSSHGRSLFRLTMPQRTMIQKLNFGWLPTNASAASSLQGDARRCPCCSQLETNHHFLTCAAPQRRASRAKMIRSLQHHIHKKSVDPISNKLCYVALLPLLSALTTTPKHSTSLSTPKVKLDGTNYGTVYWTSHQAANSSDTCPHWLPSCIATLGRGPHEYWLERNQLQHAANESPLAPQRIRVESQVRSLYDKAATLPAYTTGNCFTRSLDDLMTERRPVGVGGEEGCKT